jgi:hypothetical protein
LTVAAELDTSREEVDSAGPCSSGRAPLPVQWTKVTHRSQVVFATLDRPERTFLLNVTSSVDTQAVSLLSARRHLMAHLFDADAGLLTGDG